MMFCDEADKRAQGVECVESMGDDIERICLIWMVNRFEISLDFLSN